MSEVSNETIIAVLQEKFKNLGDQLERIEEQTTKTNGRVTSVEKKIEMLERWQLLDEKAHSVNKWWFLLVGGGIVSLLGWIVEIYSNSQK